MNRSINLFSALKPIYILGIAAVLAACNIFEVAAPAISDPYSTATPLPLSATLESIATLSGTVGYQGPSAPTSMLYIIGSQHWYSLEVPAGTPATFEQQVAPDTYQLIAFPKDNQADQKRSAAAYSTGNGIASITVTAGQRVDEIQLKNINSDLCISIPFPGSPDGLFPPIPETCSQLTPTVEAFATLRGTVGYQGPSAPASSLYIIGANQWYSVDVPAGNPATFEQQVVPGIYQLIAFPKGSQNLTNRSAAAYSTGSEIGFLTVSAGQKLDNIQVRNINSDLCISIAFPASPDGIFPAIPETCSQLTPAAQEFGTIRGTVGYQGPSAPESILYFIGVDHWYSMEVQAGNPATFEKQVIPGTYQLIAFPKGSQNQEFRPAAAYSTGNGIAILTVSSGQVIEGILVKNINPDNCVLYSFPPSPDGVFAPIPQTCDQ